MLSQITGVMAELVRSLLADSEIFPHTAQIQIYPMSAKRPGTTKTPIK